MKIKEFCIQKIEERTNENLDFKNFKLKDYDTLKISNDILMRKIKKNNSEISQSLNTVANGYKVF